eukprot:13165220-Alexandrium_andersonii.AAC.1
MMLFAIILAGVIARAPVAVVGIAGLCMCSERLVLVRLGYIARAGGPVVRAYVCSPERLSHAPE